MALVLDAEAVNRLTAPTSPKSQAVIDALAAARQLDAPITVPAAVLAEVYRTTQHAAQADALISRESLGVADTTRSLARLIAMILAAADRGSQDHVDATVVAVALASPGRSVLLTGDTDNLAALATRFPNVTVRPI